MQVHQLIPPIYLIASERSGTNLLRKLITNHQRVYYGPIPVHFLKHLYPVEPYYGLHGQSAEEGFREMVQDAIDLCKVHISPWDIKLSVEEIVSGYKKVYSVYNSVLLSHYMMNVYANAEGFMSYFCKDNHIYNYVFEILHFIPDAKFIYLYRDPRDFALSQKKRTLQTNSIRKISKLWRDEQQKCIAASMHLKSNQIMTIKYEDLIENTEDILRKICEFMGVEFLAHANNTVVMNGPIVPKEWEKKKPIIKNNSKKYLKELSTREIQEIETITSGPLRYLGYGNPVCKTSSFLYKFFDEVIIDKYSALRKKFFPDPRDRWMYKRAKMTQAIANKTNGC